MKKLINAVDDVLAESLRGFGKAHADLVDVSFEPTFVSRKGAPYTGRVSLISGGGSGHEPLHAGFVGMGMLAAAAPGHVFASPTPDQVLAAAAAVDSGVGTLFIVKNYSGDLMNFEMASEMLEGDHATILVNDDVAVEDSSYTSGRRGVAGTVMVEKIVGAAAELGADLEACRQLGVKVNGRTRSMGVALTSCTAPAVGKPIFQLGDDEMEMGVGIHGEPGRRRVALASADAIADELIAAIVGDLAPAPGTPLLLHVNGFGASPLMELYLVYDAAVRALEGQGHGVARSLVGNFTTSLDMAGCSLTVTALDDEMTGLWDAPVHTAALRWRC